jgi:hypothetical protein
MRPPPLEILGVTPGENTKAKSSSNYELITFIAFCMLSTFSATDTRGLCFYIIHVFCLHIMHISIHLTTVECEVSTSSTAGIKVIDTPP